jgi:hypothetical protein
MHGDTLQVVPAKLYVEQFKIEVPVLRIPGMGDYFPMRAFCKALGIVHQPQLQRIQSDPDFAEGVEFFDIQTAGGEQEAVCLRKREVAWWLGTMDPSVTCKLEERFSTTLVEFKQAVMDAADRLWWGVQSESPQALQSRQDHFVGYLHCRRCGARHRLEMAAGGSWSWEIEEE